ncbi:unnamed protein product, partial [marine sediment metagenome]
LVRGKTKSETILSHNFETGAIFIAIIFYKPYCLAEWGRHFAVSLLHN